MDVSTTGLSPQSTQTLYQLIGWLTVIGILAFLKSLLEPLAKWFINRWVGGKHEKHRRKNDEDVSNIYNIMRELTAILSRLDAVSAHQTRIMEQQLEIEREHVRTTDKDALLISQIHEAVIPKAAPAMGRRTSDAV
jgi:hypothetical protein